MGGLVHSAALQWCVSCVGVGAWLVASSARFRTGRRFGGLAGWCSDPAAPHCTALHCRVGGAAAATYYRPALCLLSALRVLAAL